MRRRTDKPTEQELLLLAENHRLGAHILELERAAEVDAHNLRQAAGRITELEKLLENVRGHSRYLGRSREEQEELIAEARLGSELMDILRDHAREGESIHGCLDTLINNMRSREAVERENREKCLELAEMAGARDGAARELLFLAGVEGISCLSRGGKGCIFRALHHLRPDIATVWAEGEDPFGLLHRYFPEDGD